MLGPQSAEQLTDGWILVIYSFCTVHFQHLFPCRWFSSFIFCALGIFIIFLPRTLLLTRPTEDYSSKLYVQLQRFSFGETRMIAEYLSKTLTNFLVPFKYTFGSNCRIPCILKQPLKIGGDTDTQKHRYSVTTNLGIHFVTKYPHIHVST